jgi:HEAT repeat protein
MELTPPPSVGALMSSALFSRKPTAPQRAAGLFVLLIGLTASPSLAQPPSREIVDQKTAELDRLKQAIDAEPAGVKKFAKVRDAMRAEADPNFRRLVLEMTVSIAAPAEDREAFLIAVMGTDPDAGLRSLAATALGKHGSAESLAPLARTAAQDPTTDMTMGCIGTRSSARRAATFAVAELAARHPAIADAAAARLRALPAGKVPLPDNESLADARSQALYQVTHDEPILTPFLDRLTSKDAKVRESGVVALQYFKLKDAPAALVASLADPSKDVRLWAALVLGGIGDAKTIPALMTTAADESEDPGVRANAVYSLGQMKATRAAGLMEKLIADPAEKLQSVAAVALYRITGMKVPEFPAGYNAD